MPFVIDNTVVCGWFLSDQSTGYTSAIAKRLLDDTAVSPVLWPLELANVLKTACKRGAMIASQVRGVVEQIDALPIAMDTQPPTVAAGLALALRHDLTGYNAAYPDSHCACNGPSRRKMLRWSMLHGRPAWASWPAVRNSHRFPRPSADPDAPRRP